MTTSANNANKANGQPDQTKVHVAETFKADKIFSTALNDKKTYTKIFNDLTGNKSK